MDLSREQLLSQLREIDEYDFEYLVADVWELRGWQTTVTTGSNDRGIDIIAKKSSPFNQKQLIQVKRYSAHNRIGSPDIQQYSSLRRQEDDVDAVVVVTSSSFTSQARQTADDLNVKLIEGNGLCEMILNLKSHEFLSDYFGTGVETKAVKTSPNIKNSHIKTPSKSKSNSTSNSSNIPERFKKESKTDKFGKHCPVCGSHNTVWKGKTVNTNPLLVCEGCGTRWTKKTGIIASTKWKSIGRGKGREGSKWEGEKKTASEWENMNPEEDK
jgi:hypothetical protein